MNRQLTERLHDQLSPRDLEILASLERFRLLSSRQVQRLHFGDHQSGVAAARSCNRALQRLQTLGVIAALERRIGGVRKGSASYVWHLAAAGERYLRATRGDTRRRRYMEPGRMFINHTLAVNDLAVELLHASGQHGFAVEQLTTEPHNWQRYVGSAGETLWLKPDLHVITSQIEETGIYESHTYIECDLGSEHLPRIQAKCRTYAAYYATGAYQAAHGLFPAVIWLSPTTARRAALRRAIAATSGLPAGLFQVDAPERWFQRIQTNRPTKPGPS